MRWEDRCKAHVSSKPGNPRCKNAHRENSDYCYIHRNYEESKESKTKTPQKTPAKTKTPQKPKKDPETCRDTFDPVLQEELDEAHMVRIHLPGQEQYECINSDLLEEARKEKGKVFVKAELRKDAAKRLKQAELDAGQGWQPVEDSPHFVRVMMSHGGYITVQQDNIPKHVTSGTFKATLLGRYRLFSRNSSVNTVSAWHAGSHTETELYTLTPVAGTVKTVQKSKVVTADRMPIRRYK